MDIIKNFFINPNELTLQTWEIYICDNIYDFSRHKFHKITELYIPEINLAINKQGNPINTFLSYKERYIDQKNSASGYPPKLIKTIKITGDKADTLKWIAETHKMQKLKQNELIELFEI